MMKNRIPQSEMIPQYRTLKLKLPKYGMKKSPIPQYRNTANPHVPLLTRNTLAPDITYTTCREAACLLMNRLELSYQGHPTTLFYKICWKEQILPRNLSNLRKASLFLYPVFSLLRSSSARMKIEIAGPRTALL